MVDITTEEAEQIEEIIGEDVDGKTITVNSIIEQFKEDMEYLRSFPDYFTVEKSRRHDVKVITDSDKSIAKNGFQSLRKNGWKVVRANSGEYGIHFEKEE